MRRIISIAIVLMMLTVMINNVFAEEPSITVGTKVKQIYTNKLNSLGYKVADNADEEFTYVWPYTLGWLAENENALGGNALHNAGQVSAQITYRFSGTYVAVAFCETYFAAKIMIYIDGKLEGEYTPHINDKELAVKAGESKIVYVNNKLEEGNHLLEIKHDKAYTSGDENIKPDGQKYYDNDAYFDCVIVKNIAKEEPKSIILGSEIYGYTDEVLDKLGYKAIYSSDESIIYTWPYDLDSAKVKLNKREVRFNLGQVGAEITMDFEGSYLAVVLAECYYAAKVTIDVDGEVLGEITPHTNVIKVSDTPYSSKIFFIKDDLNGGSHTLSLFLEAAHTTGEDNIKGDGKAYYDNDAFFDSIIVQKNPDQKAATPTPVTTATPTPTVTPKTTPKAEDKVTDGTKKSILLILVPIILVIGISVGVVVLIKRKKNKKV